MTLKDDLNQALAAMTKTRETPLRLDESGWAQVTLPVPPGINNLSNQQLIIEAVLSKTGKYFSLLTPLAVFDKRPGAEFLEALLYRQFSADQVDGAGFGLSAAGERDRLVALYHWPLPAITPEQFTALFQNFVKAALGLVSEVKDMARREPALILVHPD